MRKITKHWLQLALLGAGLALACAAPVLVPTPGPMPSATPTWTLLPPITLDEAQPGTNTPAPTDTPEPTATTAVLETATPTETEQGSFSCAGAPAPRLRVGDAGRVTFTDGLALRMRSSPEVNQNNIVAQVAEGTEFEVLDGPVCSEIPDSSESFVFWQIYIEPLNTRGWVAEGDSENYFVEPLP